MYLAAGDCMPYVRRQPLASGVCTESIQRGCPLEMGWIRRDCKPVSLNIVKTLVYACVSLLTNSTHVAPGCPRKSGPMTWITEVAP